MNIENLSTEFLNNMRELLGDDYDNYLKAMGKPPVSGVRINPLKVEDCLKEKVIAQLNIMDKVPFAKNGYYIQSSKIGKHPYHMAGLVYVQEPSSMLAVEASGLREEKNKDSLRILDLCAAPGGKSGQIAEILAGEGVLVSNEIEYKRAKVLQSNIERMGYTNVIITSASPQKLSEELANTFDYIFVDAPCGGEGMFRKDPDTIKEWKQERLASNSERQKEILVEANKMLKPNGKLIYSTCTFASVEDEEVSEWFAKEFGYSFIVPNQDVLGATTCIINHACRRFYPHISEGEGQFVCVMQKGEKEFCYAKKHKLAKVGNSEIRLAQEFLTNFNLPFAVNFTKVGSYLCVNNKNLQNMLEYMQFLPIINSGVTLGSIENGRLIPHHNFFMGFGKCAKNILNLQLNDPRLYKYLHGEELENPFDCKSGYAVICVDGAAVGGAKISNNALKNLLPKGVRI